MSREGPGRGAPGMTCLAWLKLSCIKLLPAWKPGFGAYVRFPKSVLLSLFPAGTYCAFLEDAGGFVLLAKGFCSYCRGIPNDPGPRLRSRREEQPKLPQELGTYILVFVLVLQIWVILCFQRRKCSRDRCQCSSPHH